MGCSSSVEAGGPETAIVPSPAGGSPTKVAPAPVARPTEKEPSADRRTINAADDLKVSFFSPAPPNSEGPGSPPAKSAIIEPVKGQEPVSAVVQGPSSSSSSFPLPAGWRVVCRLSQVDARSRWGARPRGSATAGAGSSLEANLEGPEPGQPLRLPLQLLQQWIEPAVGLKFAGRYEVKKQLAQPPGSPDLARFEVFDEQDKVRRALQVGTLAREQDVRMFVGRLQLEALDPQQLHFLRLRDVALALPGRLGIIEDLSAASLWEDVGGCQKSSGALTEKLAAAACSVLQGLSMLHDHGWALCSVSPHSICLALDGAWKVSGLQSARKIVDLSAAPFVPDGRILPEVVLGLPLSEKMDIWLLGIALCEAILQCPVCCIASCDGQVPAALQLCQLVEFLGPLPGDLVARHAGREEMFTPEGQLLRPVTPGGPDEPMLEAIEPIQQSVGSSTSLPRLKLLVEALKDSESRDEILDFLGRLLHPDPARRPSAAEALDSPFLSAEKAKLELEGAQSLRPETCHPPPEVTGRLEKAEPQQEIADEKNNIAASKPQKIKVTIKDVPGRNADGSDNGEQKDKKPRIAARKGTGFVNMADLPDSDDEEEEEEEKASAKKSAKVQIEEPTPAEGEKKDKEPFKVARKGTGFVNTADLPESDDEEEEEEEKPSAKKPANVQIDELMPAGGEKKDKEPFKVVRKGSALLNLADLPASDDEEEKPSAKKSAKVQIEEPTPAEGEKKDKEPFKVARKGTGFVNMADLPDSDDEEEEEEEKPSAKKPAKVQIEETTPTEGEKKDKEPFKVARKGTGFVNMADLPDSDDEEEEEEEKPSAKKPAKVQIAPAEGEKKDKEPFKVARKGTGFVNMADLPDSEDEDEEEEEEEKPSAKKSAKVQIEEHTPAEGEKKDKEPFKVARKGTGFVNMADLPDSDDEEEEEEEKPSAKKSAKVQIEEPTPAEGKREDKEPFKVARKGTGFVNMADLPDSEDEDEEEEGEEAKGGEGQQKKVVVQAKENGKGQPVKGMKVRKGTGFVNPADLPDDDSEEEEEAPTRSSKKADKEEEAPKTKVNFDKASSDTDGKSSTMKAPRKGTGFVNAADLNFDDEDDEDD